mmetsp:Transcript_17946/g.47681  ORF Transcript_17946/g.47681 Transcript_17946/m.47681 type:complete len:335 (-) Transcript_17946:518-1522(-)
MWVLENDDVRRRPPGQVYGVLKQPVKVLLQVDRVTLKHHGALLIVLPERVRLVRCRLDCVVLQAADASITVDQDLVPPDVGHELQERPQGMALPPGHGAHLCAAVGSRLARDLQHLVRWQEAVRHAAVVGAPGALVVLAAQVHGHVAARARVPAGGGQPAAHRLSRCGLCGLPAVCPLLGGVVLVPLLVCGGVEKALHHVVGDLRDVDVAEGDPVQVLDEVVLFLTSEIRIVVNVVRIQKHVEGQQVKEPQRSRIPDARFHGGAPRLRALQVVERGHLHVAGGLAREVQVRPRSAVVTEHALRRAEQPDGVHGLLPPSVLFHRQADGAEPVDDL